MIDFHFIFEHQFVEELDAIEPDHLKQFFLQLRIEEACVRHIADGFSGHGCAPVSWKHALLAEYRSEEAVVYLLSARHDSIAVLAA